MPEDLLRSAVRNNAEWCELVARSHGVSGKLLEKAWRTTGTMPPFYPNVVSIEAGMQRDEVSRLAENLPLNCGWKDSYADLDLTEFDFTVRFEANWYMHAGGALGAAIIDTIDTVTTAGELEEWIAAWGDTPPEKAIFLPALMGPKVRFIFRRSAGQIDAGLIANVSRDAIGITNAFGHPDGIAQCMRDTLGRAEGMPLVGYGSDDDLRMLEDLGFKGLGKLKIWVR